MKLELSSGIAYPAVTTLARRDGSVRLTTHIDIEPHEDGRLSLAGGARELRTASGDAEVIGFATVEAEVGPDRVLVDLRTSSPIDKRNTSPHPIGGTDLSSLVGRVVGSGFRAAVDAMFGELEDEGGPLHLLLDDLPAAALISGYAALYSGKMQIERKHLRAGVLKANICAGWGDDATMLATLKT